MPEEGSDSAKMWQKRTREQKKSGELDKIIASSLYMYNPNHWIFHFLLATDMRSCSTDYMYQ